MVVMTPGAGGAGKRTAPDDVQRLLVEQWRRAIIKEKVAAKQRRLVSAVLPGCPSSLDEITVVTRIGRETWVGFIERGSLPKSLPR